MKYTLEQFKEYLNKQGSLGDTIYNLKDFESFLDRKHTTLLVKII